MITKKEQIFLRERSTTNILNLKLDYKKHKDFAEISPEMLQLLEEKTPDYALFKLFASMQIGNQADVDRIIDVAVCENKPRYGIGDETAYNLSRDERNMRLSRQALKSLNAKKQAH